MKSIHGDRKASNRAEDYDYTQAGWYYVTVCTHELQSTFGDVVDGTMIINAFGQIVSEEWFRTTTLRPNVELDSFVVMPNHFHGIIVIHEDESPVRATRRVALGATAPPVSTNEDCGGPSERSLGVIVGQIKSASSRRINALRETPGAPVWHRNYYDHIIRNDKDVDRIRAYIAGNPGNWQYDRANRSQSPKETPIP